MKTSCLALLVISGALTVAASDADASNPVLQQSGTAANIGSERKSDADPPDIVKPRGSTVPTGKRRVQQTYAKANRVPPPASVAKVNRSKHPPSGQARPTAGTPGLHPQSRLSQSAAVAKKGSIQNKSVTSISAVQRPRMFPSSSPSFDNLRRCGPNPAVIGGLGTSKPSETGAINGSRFSRKP